MSLLTLLVLITVVGVFVGLIVTYVPMPQPFKSMIVVVSVVAILLVCLHSFGIFADLRGIRV
jgi:hypothetical protein